MKIRGKKDMTKLTVAFRNFAHAQNKMGIQERKCDCIHTRQIYTYQIFSFYGALLTAQQSNLILYNFTNLNVPTSHDFN